METNTKDAEKKREEANQKARDRFKLCMESPQYREKRNARKRACRRRASADPLYVEHVRQKNRESAARRMANADYREGLYQKLRERKKDPVTRKQINARRVARKSDPAYRERINRAERERRQRMKQIPEYREREKQKRREYQIRCRHGYKRQRFAVDLPFKLRHVLSARMRKVLRSVINGAPCPRSKLGYVGCTVDQLMQFLELKFEPGMSWNNWGKAWHIDHIKPIASFDLTNETERHLAFGYQNLQPLWAFDNISKGDRHYPEYTQLLLLL